MILNEIDYDCLVNCFYIFSDEVNYYYVMEYVGGGDVGSFIRKHTPNNQVIRLFIAETVLGLNYLHEKSIYHRDIKPENILIAANVNIYS